MINIVGNRRIIKELGQGGMGVVYLAEHIHLDKRFAIKSLRKELTSNPQFRQLFFQEANNQGRLDHPNIVQVTDYEEQHGQFFLVMEYVDGEDLDQLIRRKGKLTVKEALPIMKGILTGLGYAHRNAMIHRDIKPSNIMVDKEGRARVTDFGLSVLMSDESCSDQVGTPEYQSPEQIDPNILAQGEMLDHRTDIYSLGIVLYEMLTGTIPFEGDHEAVYQQQLHSPIPDPRKINKRIPQELAKIIKRCVAKKPVDRFQGCDELLKKIIAYEKKKTWLRILATTTIIIFVVSLGTYFLTRQKHSEELKKLNKEIGIQNDQIIQERIAASEEIVKNAKNYIRENCKRINKIIESKKQILVIKTPNAIEIYKENIKTWESEIEKNTKEIVMIKNENKDKLETILKITNEEIESTNNKYEKLTLIIFNEYMSSSSKDVHDLYNIYCIQ